jgi:hypothetical protein
MKKKSDNTVPFHSMKIRITLLEEMLGTKPSDSKVFETYIASKHPSGVPQKDELESAAKCEERGSSIFHKEDGTPYVEDYCIKGFFKEACGSLRNADGTKSKELKAYKTRIDGLIFTYPRFILAEMPTKTEIGVCQRPLRAETMQGPRVTVVSSETLPKGTTFDVEIHYLANSLLPLITEWLNYGRYRGLGGWRNSGKGRFSWKKI